MDNFKIMNIILVISSIVYIADASLCKPNLFGTGCRFQCHCKDNKQCDEVTGQCPEECEINWAGPSCQYRNIALDYVFTEHSHATASSRLAIDGDASTCTKVENGKSKPWWRIWLSNTYTITELEIIINESYKEYFKQLKVTVEHVPKEIATQTLDEYIFPKVAVCYENNPRISGTTINVVCNKPLEGNQVRIQLGGGTKQLSLCDVRIFQGRNIAFGRRTSQSTDDADGGKSLVAVDGSTKREQKACSLTAKESKPWWSVDLAHVIVINRINITTLNANDVRGYIILVSNDSLQWSTVYQHTSKSAPLTNISMDVTARFVKVTLGGTQQLRLCEVQVLGDCLPNVCGFDCSEPCYCKTYSSNIKMSGECPNGCLDNWTGENKTCNTVTSCLAPPGVTLSVVAFTCSILGVIIFTTVSSVVITIFVMKRRQTSSSASSNSHDTSRNDSQRNTRSQSGQFTRLRLRMALYYNTTLRPKNRRSDSENTEEYNELEVPPPRKKTENDIRSPSSRADGCGYKR